MIVFPMLILLVLAIVAAVESFIWWEKRRKASAALAGFSAALLLWNAWLYWPPFHSIALGLLVAGMVLMIVQLALTRRFRGFFLVAAFMTGACLTGFWQGGLSYLANRPVAHSLTVVNADGDAARAAIVYHPGLSSFQNQLQTHLANGLADHDWAVDIYTASAQAPRSFEQYDLLIVSSPTYDWRPSRLIRDYLSSLQPLNDKPVVAVISGAGYTEQSQSILASYLEQAGGKVLAEMSFWTMRPPDSQHIMIEHLAWVRSQGKNLAMAFDQQRQVP